jgi:hypothetical protein
VFAGERFMIRLGGEFGGEPGGFLTVRCEIDDCNDDNDPDLWQIENGIVSDCNVNGNPDECDVPFNPWGVDPLSEDCNANGIPDECEIDVEANVHCLPGQENCYDGPFFCLFNCDPDVDENGIPDICGGKCPGGVFSWSGELIDARQPHEIDDSQPQGIDTVVVEGLRGADVSGGSPCWELCETDTGGLPDNDMTIVEDPPGTYTVTLDRPITAGATTTITYTDDTPTPTSTVGTFTALPGDVNGNRLVEVADIDQLINCLNGLACEEWQTDINRSGETNAQDLLRLIDVLNGAHEYEFDPPGGEGWLGKSAPSGCP